MSDQSADAPAPDPSPAPIGMRELPPQPAKPVMPAYTLPSTSPVSGDDPIPAGYDQRSAPGGEDSVIARDDHFEGTFTSRGTVVVMGSVKGRIESVRVRIEPGARVEADVIVDEAIVAGTFTGNLTCRERLEARPSGRISGRVETYKLMLHEGASVEGEMHMLSEAPRDASETIRGTAPLRGETPAGSGGSAVRSETPATSPAIGSPAGKLAPAVTPSSAAKSSSSASKPSPQPTANQPAAAGTPAHGSAAVPTIEAAARQRTNVAETLRLESLRVAPRTTTAGPGYSGQVSSGTGASNGNGGRGRTGTTTTGF